MAKKIPTKKGRVDRRAKPKSSEYHFRLFITGVLPNSIHAINNGKAIFEKYLKGRYELEIIDIYQQPELALTEEIIAVPVLIKKLPLPEERLVGDLSETALVLQMLNLKE